MDWSRLHCIVIINVDRQAVTAVFGYIVCFTFLHSKRSVRFCKNASHCPRSCCRDQSMFLDMEPPLANRQTLVCWKPLVYALLPMQPAAEHAVTLACVLNGKVKMTNGNAQSAEGTSASQRPAKPTKPAWVHISCLQRRKPIKKQTGSSTEYISSKFTIDHIRDARADLCNSCIRFLSYCYTKCRPI